MTLLYPSKFESLDASLSYTFSLHNMEAQFEQGMRVPLSIGVGSDYAHDHLGYGIAPRSAGSIRIRQTIVETTEALVEAKIHEARAECLRIGKGWLYRTNQDATSHRCLARINSMPSYQRGGYQSLHMPLIFDFTQLSDWQGTSATSSSQLIDSPNESVSITVSGNLPVYDVTFRLRNTGTTRATSPIVFNTTTGQRLCFLRSMNVADHELYYATASRLARFSDNNGASYQNDYSNFVGTDFQLNPGANVLKVCCGRPHILPWLNTIGDSDFTLEWSYNERYT